MKQGNTVIRTIQGDITKVDFVDAIVNAATTLQQLIDSGASQNDVTAAMTILTQAMIGIY